MGLGFRTGFGVTGAGESATELKTNESLFTEAIEAVSVSIRPTTIASPKWLPNQHLEHFCDAMVRQPAESAWMTALSRLTEGCAGHVAEFAATAQPALDNKKRSVGRWPHSPDQSKRDTELLATHPFFGSN